MSLLHSVNVSRNLVDLSFLVLSDFHISCSDWFF